MKTKKKMFPRIFAAVMAFVMLAGQMPSAFAVTKIKVKDGGSCTLSVDEEAYLYVPGYSKGELVWASSDEDIVECDEASDGGAYVEAESTGTTTIIAIPTSSSDNEKYRFTIKVTGSSSSDPWITVSNDYVEVDESITLDYDYGPSRGYDLTFSSSDTDIATVDDNGKVKGHKEGTVTITANYGSARDKCTVEVTEDADFSLNDSKLTINVGDKKRLRVKSSWSDSKIYWSSDDNDIATVDSDGYVTGRSHGTTTIRAELKSNSRIYDTCRVTVEETGGSGTIKLTVPRNGRLDFDVNSFNDFSREICNSDIDYIEFTSIPLSSRGILYYRYGSGSESKVLRDDTYKRSGSRQIGDLTFVPASDYSGMVEYTFTGRSSGGAELTGTLTIIINNADGDVVIKASAGSPAKISSTCVNELNEFCRKMTSAEMDYIKFDAPSGGDLYYRKGDSDEKRVDTSTAYYYKGNPKLEELTFVPGGSNTGTILLSFSGYNIDRKTFSGTIAIKYEAEKHASDISYTVGEKGYVKFRFADFDRVCSERGEGNIDKVMFTLPDPDTGKLCYNYEDESSYTDVTESASYSIGTSYLIENVYFIPAPGITGTAEIEYTGIDKNGLTYNGKVEIKMTGTSAVVNPDKPSADQNGEPANVGDFTDVFTKDYFAEPVVWAIEQGITNGTTLTTFSPEAKCRNEHIITFLWRAVGKPEPEIENPFTDVPDEKYYAKAAVWAYEKGMIEGKKFHPEDPCTRSDTVKYLWILAGKPEASTDQFTDVPEDADYAEAVAWAVDHHITNGTTTTTFTPDGTCKRAEIVTFLWRDLADKVEVS